MDPERADPEAAAFAAPVARAMTGERSRWRGGERLSRGTGFGLSMALLLTLATLTSTVTSAVTDEEIDPAAIAALRAGEAVVLMRHALAPGTGDPVGFERGDCTTQRNLSDAGRAQAVSVGRRLATLLDGKAMAVYSSAWCRCLDTARLLDVGPVEPLPALDSFFQEREHRAARTGSLDAWLSERLADAPGSPTAVLVTHQVNITALTGAFAASGEALIVTREAGRTRVLATFETAVP